MAKQNIFEKAKKNTSKKKTEKHEVIEKPELEKALSEIERLNKEIAELEAKKAQYDLDVRETGKETMIDLYNKTKKYPGTFKIKAGNMSMMYVPMDKYKTIDEDRYEELLETYGENIAEEETRYFFNKEILEKHMDHISNLLMKSKVLSETEKEELLKSETKYTVKKGTIKDLFSFTDDVEEIIEDIQPVLTVKSIKRDENV